MNEWIKDGYVVETFERPNYISALSIAIKITVEDKVKKRLCLDASHLNDLLLSEPTKLGTLEVSERLVKEGDYFTTLDLSNAYFHVKLHEKDHNKVAFAFPITNDKNEDRYRFFYFKILVYGLKPAAMVLNTLTKPLLDHLATRDIKSNIFIDDQRINNDTAVAVSEDTLIVKKVFNKAGWVFNDEKETPPEQVVYYLGLWFDSTSLRYSVHEHKIAQIERRISKLEERNCSATPQELASIVGKFVSCELATTYAPRLRCHKYFSWLSKVIKTDKDWKNELHFPKSLITAFKKAIQDVREFSGKVRRRRYNYKEIHPDQPVPCEKEFAGDGNELLGAYYSVEEPHHFKIVKYENSEGEQLSSTHRELLVLNRCISDNAHENRGKDLIYYTDSRVLHFWHLYGTANGRMADLLRQVKQTCVKYDIRLEVTWRPRTDALIQLADTSCRSSTDEYSIPNLKYKQICHFFKFRPAVDLFASTLLQKTPFFYSERPTLGSAGANALNFPWNQKSYCHPPRNLVFDVFRKIEAEKQIDMVLILLKSSHNTDLKRFVGKDDYFKDYVKMVVTFDSRVHSPVDRPSRFLICNHTWYALRIVKNDERYRFNTSDIYRLD